MHGARWRAVPVVLVLYVAASADQPHFARSAESPATGKPSPDAGPGQLLFGAGAVPTIAIAIDAANLDALRSRPRAWARATVRLDQETYAEVGIHLKGSAGSWRSIDDRPSLTLGFDEFSPGRQFHGLRKVHLNNAVEDPSYLNEWLGTELFRSAGVPAPRSGHALVQLNGRRLGLYVLKEGFTEEFLALHFRQTSGNLYEPGPGHDVNEPLDRKSGSGPNDGADLQALAAAAQEPDRAARWGKLEQVLDLDRFLSFMAMEILSGHRDGYCLARNNFRIYHDPELKRMVFLPHGMDQLFGNPRAQWLPRMSGLVARAVLETPQGQRRYRERFEFLYTNAFRVERLNGLPDQLVARLRPALTLAEHRELSRQAALVKERLARRHLELGKQLSQPEPAVAQFREGQWPLRQWKPVDEPKVGRLVQTQAPDGRQALCIQAGQETGASWRTRARLAAGRYRFEGAARVAGVLPLAHGRNHGAGLRVGARRVTHPHDLTGDSDWRPLSVEFAVETAEEEVELICELRAQRGQAWFDLESLRLVRRPGLSP